jgi:hypothetical protein
LEGLAKDDVGIFYGHLVYFAAIWYTLCTFGIFSGYWVYFPPFWYIVPRKIWQPWFWCVRNLTKERKKKKFPVGKTETIIEATVTIRGRI